MPSRTLPDAAVARVEQILADTERELIALQSTPRLNPHWTGDVLYIEDLHGSEQLRLALVAAEQIVDVIGPLEELPATVRRRAVEDWHDQVRQRCGIDRARFLAKRREQDWWYDFQLSLPRAGLFPVAPVVPEPAIPTRTVAFKKQLATAMTAKRILVPELAAAASTTERAIWNYLAGTRVPSRRGDIIRQLEHALGTTFHLTEHTVSKKKRGPHRTPKRAKPLRKTRRNAR